MSTSEAVALYTRLNNDRTLTIADVRVAFEPIVSLSKSELETLSRAVGYMPCRTRKATIELLRNNLESIKLSQHRVDRIRNG